MHTQYFPNYNDGQVEGQKICWKQKITTQECQSVDFGWTMICQRGKAWWAGKEPPRDTDKS